MNRYRITLTELSIAFISFGVLLSAALLYAETTADVGFWRTVYTIWVTTVLVTPALCADDAYIRMRIQRTETIGFTFPPSVPYPDWQSAFKAACAAVAERK